MRRVTTVGCVLERGTFDSLRHPVNTDTNKRDLQIDFAIIIRFSRRMHNTEGGGEDGANVTVYL